TDLETLPRVWLLQAQVAMALNWRSAGAVAGDHLRQLAAQESTSEVVAGILADLEQRGWFRRDGEKPRFPVAAGIYSNGKYTLELLPGRGDRYAGRLTVGKVTRALEVVVRGDALHLRAPHGRSKTLEIDVSQTEVGVQLSGEGETVQLQQQ